MPGWAWAIPAFGGVVLAAVGVFAGGIVEEVDGATSTFRSMPRTPPLVILGGVASVGFGGLTVRARHIRLGLFCVIMGVVSVALGTVMVFAEVVVDDDHFESSFGYPFVSYEWNVRFEDVTSIAVMIESRPGRDGRPITSYLLWVETRTGREQVPVSGELMAHGGAKKILSVAAAKGIPISGTLPAAKRPRAW